MHVYMHTYVVPGTYQSSLQTHIQEGAIYNTSKYSGVDYSTSTIVPRYPQM